MTEAQAVDAQASSFMEEGIRLMQSGDDVDAALLQFNRALELRRQLPTELPEYAYGLAACWLNRAEALTRLGSDYHALTLDAYDEALTLLRRLPSGDDGRFSRRLAIALQNRALVLAAQNPPETEEAIIELGNAIGVLDRAEALDVSERNYLCAVVWVNLANIRASEDTIVSDVAAREAARRSLLLVKAHEHESAAAAEAGLNARHVFCRIAARRLSGEAKCETLMMHVHEATDFAEEALRLAREWERRGVNRFRELAADLLRFGARVYSLYQPQFLREFLDEQSESQQFAGGSGKY